MVSGVMQISYSMSSLARAANFEVRNCCGNSGNFAIIKFSNEC